MVPLLSPQRVCRHCRTRVVSRSRNLCRGCFDDAAVRDTYPVPDTVAKFTRVGAGAGLGGGKVLPPCPTDARPGTAEKITELARRAGGGFALFHPRDAVAD